MDRRPPREPKRRVFLPRALLDALRRLLQALPPADRHRVVAGLAGDAGPRPLLTPAERIGSHSRNRVFKAVADPEVRAFIDATTPLTPSYQEVARLARERFGPARAPSKSSIHRYWMRLPSAERDRLRAVATRAGRQQPVPH
jgi:hypothetical protein